MDMWGRNSETMSKAPWRVALVRSSPDVRQSCQQWETRHWLTPHGAENELDRSISFSHQIQTNSNCWLSNHDCSNMMPDTHWRNLCSIKQFEDVHCNEPGLCQQGDRWRKHGCREVLNTTWQLTFEQRWSRYLPVSHISSQRMVNGKWQFQMRHR